MMKRNTTKHEPPGYNSRSGRHPRRRGHPGIDCTRIRRIESCGFGVECKRRSIDRRDNDRGVTSFVVCVHDEVECRLATAEGLLRGLTAGVP